MLLSVGQSAVFKTYNRRVVMGRVVAICNGVYYVLAADMTRCSMFPDGLFRFRDQDVVR